MPDLGESVQLKVVTFAHDLHHVGDERAPGVLQLAPEARLAEVPLPHTEQRLPEDDEVNLVKGADVGVVGAHLT